MNRPEQAEYLLSQVVSCLKRAWQRRVALVGRLWPVAFVPAAFASFVVWNGGVVVGDRAAHVPVKHLTQPLYFSLFSSCALAPVLLSPAR